MVERRMQKAILTVGSIWYSAWLDAGQPDLMDVKKNIDSADKANENLELDAAFDRGLIYGRKH